MKHLTNTLLMALSAAAAFGQAGHWEANLQVPDRVIGLVIDIDKNAKGEWIASFAVPAQNLSGLAVSDLKIDGQSVKFKVAGIPNAPSFDLKLAGETKMAGSLVVPQAELPVEFEKKGDAKITLPVPAAAVSKELEGDWTGSIETPNGKLDLVVHFKNNADRTVTATMDSPTQGAKDLKLSEISQKEKAVEFKLLVVGGGYKGTINKEGTEMTGEWSQGGGSVPLKLTKK